MNKNLYRKLAWQNIRNNKDTFLPFGICSIARTTMFYMFCAISDMTGKSHFYGDESLIMLLNFGVWVTGIFAFFVILYTNSFLMKRRSKEFGLYSMLGMEKRHISRIVFWEMAIVGGTSILGGLVIGMLFSRLIFLFLAKLVGIPTNIGFTISVGAIGTTLSVFVLFFMATILGNVIRIARLKPIDLMRSTKTGEKEPKARWLLAILGVLSLGFGYYLSLSVTNPVKALGTFFIAVLFVIAGTYLLFISGSIALLKMLKNNKHFYYQKNHFVTVSGLMYRMKQNAAGLASICILSTMVLVTIFSTVALYTGTEDCIRTMCPTDVSIEAFPEMEYDENHHFTLKESDYAGEKFDRFLDNFAADKKVEITDRDRYYVYIATGLIKGEQFVVSDDNSMSSSMSMVFLMTEKDYETHSGKKVNLKPGEAMIYSTKNKSYSGKQLHFGDKSLSVVGMLPAMDAMSNLQYMMDDFVTVVVRDMDEIRAIDTQISFGSVDYVYDFNLTGDKEDIVAFCRQLDEKIKDAGFDDNRTITDIYSERQSYMNLYGSLLFIGIFVGLLFMAATVMIIYYKQISEGYDDRERFVIMQKVGMSEREVKGTIHSQILLVFFLPIILACMHIAFAFPAIKRIFRMLGLVNIPLMVGCLIATVVIYVIGYGIVYVLTARTYYKIVK